jgi:FlaG/FlaF family flagellin (archaellin)
MKNDTAVSPILGTLLIVLLTIVLAAVLSAFMLGFVETPQMHKGVYATAHQEGETIYVTYLGGAGENEIVDGSVTALVNEQAMQTPFPKTGKLAVGTSASTAGTLGKDHVLVTVMYRDGGTAVVLDTWV